MEEALALVGRALERLPGAKSVIVFGHGFGRLGMSGVDLAADYDEARLSLRAARASVFCLDVTQADYHSLKRASSRPPKTPAASSSARTCFPSSRSIDSPASWPDTTS